MSGESRIPIWYFIGWLLLIYGLLLLGAGIYQFSHPPATVLANLHATFWGGVLMTLIGLAYVIFDRPKKGV